MDIARHADHVRIVLRNGSLLDITFTDTPLYAHRTDKGTRTGILDYIDKATDECIAQFLMNASTLPEPIRQALYTHQLNQFIKELNALLTQYENSKK